MMEKLKPCPFCGVDAKLFDTESIYGNYFWVECCGLDCPIPEIVTEDYETKQEAIRVWNTRV